MTLIDKSIADDLDGEEQPLCLRWTNGVERRDASSKIVRLNISQYHDSRCYEQKDVRTIENLQLPSQIDMESLSSTYEHLKNVNIQSFKEVEKYKFGKDDEPAAAKTLLGWCLFGSNAASGGSVLHVEKCGDCEERSDARLEDMVRENFYLEAIGVSDPSTLPQAKEDKVAMDILNSTVKWCGQKFETGLLWKYRSIRLPNSLPMAKRRLMGLEKNSNQNLKCKQ